MKKLLSFSLFVAILLLMLIGAKSAQAQRVIITRSTVMIPSTPNGNLTSTQGYWKWSPRFQKYIWVTHPKVRFRFHRGYRVRI